MDNEIMDQEVVYLHELEDGELSDNSDHYTPLQRPASMATTATSNTKPNTNVSNKDDCSPLATCHQMQEALEEDDSQVDSCSDTSSSGSSDNCLNIMTNAGSNKKTIRKHKKRVKRTIMVRVKSNETVSEDKRSRFKKYNVWTAALQEDALTETMRGCDVTNLSDRNVETYDFLLHRRLNGENGLKRRLSNSTDDFSDTEMPTVVKRGRPSSRGADNCNQRRSVKSRLGRRHCSRRGSSPTSGSDNSYESRHLDDLKESQESDPIKLAKEIAMNLKEEKNDLMISIVETLGTEIPIEIYKETQRIEADGGMMIMNGLRRRTSGGVFLFLLKNDDRITIEQQTLIFRVDRQNMNKRRKEVKSKSRDLKVEELKKRLSEQEKDLPALSTRKDHFLLGSDLSLEAQPENLSNPPPSPVGIEQSPDYKTHAINHVTSDVSSPEKPSTSASILAALATSSISTDKDLISYDDDILDVNCGEMDFF